MAGEVGGDRDRLGVHQVGDGDPLELVGEGALDDRRAGRRAQQPAEHDRPQPPGVAAEHLVEAVADQEHGEALAERAEKRVALPRSPVTFQAAARAIRPPSSGKAGTRLKTSSTTLSRRSSETSSVGMSSDRVAAQRRGVEQPVRPGDQRSSAARRRSRSRASRAARRRRPGTRRPGESVSRLIFITPPNRNSSIPVTSIPSRRAATAWPELVQQDRAEEQHRGGHRDAERRPCPTRRASSRKIPGRGR